MPTKQQPGTYGDDVVVPVHFIDQAAIMNTSIISYTFQYDEILHAGKLHAGLADLIRMPGWSKVGGRLRATKSGKLEIHIPSRFSPARPPVHFTHNTENATTRLAAHPLGSKVPQPTGSTPSIQAGSHDFRSYALPPSVPNDIRHYLRTDQPLLTLHVTSFADATLVALTFPHSLTDAMGASQLLRSWADVVSGRRRIVPPPQGTEVDPLQHIGTAADAQVLSGPREFVLERQQTRGLVLAVFIARYVWDTLTRRSIQAKHMYLPAQFIAALRAGVEEDLRRGSTPAITTTGNEEEEEVPFVSDGDLILAWGTRVLLSSSSAWAHCSAVICNVFDLRARLDSVFKTTGSGGPYLQNLILPATTVLSRDEAAGASVADIARRVRRAIVEQTTDAQVRRLLHLARVWFSSMGMMPLFARWDSRVISCTNWSKARFLEAADFGPRAVVAETPAVRRGGQNELEVEQDKGNKDKESVVSVPGDEKANATPGKPVMYWGTTLSVTDKPRDCFVIYGKDAGGNYWVHGYLRSETWTFIEKELKKYE